MLIFIDFIYFRVTDIITFIFIYLFIFKNIFIKFHFYILIFSSLILRNLFEVSKYEKMFLPLTSLKNKKLQSKKSHFLLWKFVFILIFLFSWIILYFHLNFMKSICSIKKYFDSFFPSFFWMIIYLWQYFISQNTVKRIISSIFCIICKWRRTKQYNYKL